MSLDDDGVHFEGPPIHASLDWSGIGQFVCGQTCLVIAQHPHVPWVIVPVSAFLTDRELSAFVAFVEGHWRRPQ